MAILNNITTSIMKINGTTIPIRHVTIFSQIVLTLVYVCGIIGNIAALITLFHRDKKRNRKHSLMLRCLATNDLIALVGMLIQMNITIYFGSVASTRLFCSMRILWRLFGLFSGCVAIVMAVDRWLALTKPFVYQKRVSYHIIVRCMIVLWIATLSLTTMPLFGFGLYYENGKCIRYREARKLADIVYAYIWCTYGTLLCLLIVICNLGVSRVLKKLGRYDGALRRVSRASSRNKLPKLLIKENIASSQSIATVEERAFARLMSILSITFVICWMPQMIAIPLEQYNLQLPKSEWLIKKCIGIFYKIADILLCLHFTLDPYIYVLLHIRKSRTPIMKYLCGICVTNRSRTSSFAATSGSHHHDHSGGVSTPLTDLPSTPINDEIEIHHMIISYDK
ncbi:hypothetical protein PV325_006924 [Microctonus aethiopoides]|uniref:G-protein coupled receptors family 1 profile domain-containing protein n=1 Tax=Microctonus aethiopoides TaxID=144406 RepID=A0AA39KQM7_9HYME|nr:hypothetical protein PV325_006924 [Microctonus aethiopoides]KAK0094283.1 hypothetical protein PV326_011357 [Microctonus aethiopoides]KAK0170303.1 hypothetical protein PV328_010881 [Microctonus aethiopoides]